MKQVGVDEAGRGCVIGPLVVAIVAATDTDRRWFAKWRVRDSKLVAAEKRTALAKKIMDRCWYRIYIATPAEIDVAVRDRSRTLNGLELEMMSRGLRDFLADHPEEKTDAYIDAPSINAIACENKLHTASAWPEQSRLYAQHHADTRHRIVGAASIVAKTERERLITELKQELGCDFGCGYTHDLVTIEHLKTVTPGATHIRWSWVTAQRMSNTRS